MGLWKGRIIGAVLGLMLANPLTALIGFLLGWCLVDKPKIRAYRAAQEASYAFTYRQGLSDSGRIIELTYAFMGYVARGAGRINEDHIRKAEQFMQMMGLDDTGRQMAINAFNRGKTDNFDFPGQINRLISLTGGNKAIISYFIEIQVQIALADGTLERGEQDRLLVIGRCVGFTSDQINRLISIRCAEMEAERRWGNFGQQYNYGSGTGHDFGYQGSRQQGSYNDNSRGGRRATSEDLRQAYEILGVNRKASFEEIKKAHKKLMLKYHPDKLASQGLPPEMIKLYTQKAQDIQAAFNLIQEQVKEK